MNLSAHLNDPLFRVISELSEQEKSEVYVIGGYVRDILLQRESHDIDILVVGNGIEFAEKAGKALDGKTVHVYKNFGTALIRAGDKAIEFVGARKESYRQNSRKPIVENGTLEDDQNRRDFTINTLGVSLQKKNFGELIDPFHGLDDLYNKIICTPLDPDLTFSDDPLRMVRAIRFAAQLGFRVEQRSYDSIIRNKERIAIVSRERVTDELNKVIMVPVPSAGFKLLYNTGLLRIIFPQMTALCGVEVVDGKSHKDNFYHTLKVLDNLSLKSEDLWLRWAAILHDIAKPATKRFDKEVGWTFHGHEFLGAKMVKAIFRQMRLPLNEKMNYVEKLVRLHLRPIVLSQEIVTDSALRRLLVDAGEDIEDLMMLCEADITSKNDIKVAQYMKNLQLVRKKLKAVEERDHLRNWQPPITGEEIMRVFGLSPSKAIGILKDAIREAILDGKVQNTHDDAYHFMIEKGKEMGLEEVSGKR